MKTAFIATVYNEESTIINFLESLFHQTKTPDEIIIVDGGSTDNTLTILNEYITQVKSKVRTKILLFSFPCNRAKGRNYAIQKSHAEIIACSDAGCMPDSEWFAEIIKPLAKSTVSVVSGYYKPVTKNYFQKALAAYTCIPEDRVSQESFLPSSRSIAFKKTAWGKVGGYPEYLTTCEDLVFASTLRKRGFPFSLQKHAVVYWPQKKNIYDAFRLFFSYARGDGKAHYFRRYTPLLFIRYIIGFILLFLVIASRRTILTIGTEMLLLLYMVWAIQKNYRYVDSIHAYYLLPLLQLTADIAVLSGTTLGIIESIYESR